jgi:hypothetical protein
MTPRDLSAAISTLDASKGRKCIFSNSEEEERENNRKTNGIGMKKERTNKDNACISVHPERISHTTGERQQDVAGGLGWLGVGNTDLVEWTSDWIERSGPCIAAMSQATAFALRTIQASQGEVISFRFTIMYVPHKLASQARHRFS